MPILMNNFPEPNRYRGFNDPDSFNRWLKVALIATALFVVLSAVVCLSVDGCRKKGEKKPVERGEERVEKREAPAEALPDLTRPVRKAPRTFPPNTNLPRGKETLHSGAIDLKSFDPKRDLVRFEDTRVWFESDHDSRTGDNEDDHLINRAMEIPLKRLVNLVGQKRGKLKIQDTYRPAAENRVHMARSLHCEGRAIDLTCEGISLTELAKLCWQSGFDFVLYEVPKHSGVHLHCSVKRAEKKKTE